jgi:DNA-binding transcriptional LysR family regulator
MGHSSEHIGLDCPQWRFAGGQSGIAECLRSGRGSPKFHGCGTAAWRVVIGGREGSVADGGTARRSLFHRSTRSITLTAEGMLFLERCRRIFSEIEAAELELSQTQEAPRGTLRVSLPLVGMLMMPTLVAFMRSYPEITLDLDFSDRVVDVIEEGFDAVVRFAEIGDSRLMTRALGTYRKSLVAAPAYLAARGVPLIPDDLKAHACLHHKFPTSRKLEQWPLRPEHAGIETELPRTAVASTIEPLICMAVQGMGIACLPDFAISRQLREGVLVAVLDDYAEPSETLRVLWPSSRHLSPKLRVFVDFLATNLFDLFLRVQGANNSEHFRALPPGC